ncbi:unnamed protein product [Mytilus edulis]|uniref:Uncharacterized protein n=1 Tax=Mytilus edulis TaxID=6550 RepID=A0A8S3UD29_MYTED|nr:unnamed protein product [Mytilus edulis]
MEPEPDQELISDTSPDLPINDHLEHLEPVVPRVRLFPVMVPKPTIIQIADVGKNSGDVQGPGAMLTILIGINISIQLSNSALRKLYSDNVDNRRNMQNIVQNSPDSSDNQTIIVTNNSSVNNSTDVNIPTNNDSSRVLEESVNSANINSASNSAPGINLDINTKTSAHVQEAASAKANNKLLINTIELCQQTLKQVNSRQSMLEKTIPSFNLQSAMAACFMPHSTTTQMAEPALSTNRLAQNGQNDS